MRDDFSNGPPNERWFFQWAKLAKEKCIYQWVGSAKEKWVFLQADRATKKERVILLHINPGRHNIGEVFKPAPVDKNIVMHFTQETTNINMPMKCVFCFHYRNINQNLLIFLISVYTCFIIFLQLVLFYSDLLMCFWKTMDVYM